jgi:hypothetical protein
MLHRLAKTEGEKLYALRRQIPNRCLASSNRRLGSGSFCCAGLDKVRGEWRLVIIAWNVKRMFTLNTR